MNNIKVGSRVLYNLKFKGTVRFMGETDIAKGLLVGVELDTPNGKLNGIVNDRTYFTCEENHGVFVRLSQLSEIEEEKVEKIIIEQKPVKIAETRRQTFIPNINIESHEKENQFTQPSRITDTRKPIRRTTMAPRIEIVDNQQNVENPSTFKGLETKKEIWRNSAILDSKKPIGFSQDHKNEIKDLKDQIETLKTLKKKDRENLLKSESSKKELEQEVKRLKEINDLFKSDMDKLSNDFTSYQDTMKSVEEDIELVTIDKEMAEEQLEQSRLEYNELKKKFDHIKDEYESLKQCDCDGSSGKRTYIYQADLMEKYKSAIIDMNNTNNKLKYENETKDSELTIHRELQIFNETEIVRLETLNKKYDKDLKEMKDLVDSTADIEIILDKLTYKNEFLESELEITKNRMLQLDEMEDKNNEIIEDKNKEIRQLKEEIECMNSLFHSVEEKINAKKAEDYEYEKLCEQYQNTITNLKQEIQSLQSEIVILEDKLQISNECNRRYSLMTYATQNNMQNDIIRIVDDKLRKIELDEKRQQLSILYRYLPSSFSLAGGEDDSIRVVLLVNRLIDKIAIVLDYIKEQRRTGNISIIINESDDKYENNSNLLRMELLLVIWKTIVKQIKINVEYCNMEILHKVAMKYIQLSSHESSIDCIINLMKRPCLEAGRNLINVQSTIDDMQTLYNDLFSNRLLVVDCNIRIRGFFAVVYRATECLNHDFNWLTQLITSHNIRSENLINLIDKLKVISWDIQSKMKSAFVILQQCQQIKFNMDISRSMDSSMSDLISIVECVWQFCIELNDDNITNDNNVIDKLMDIFANNRRDCNSLDIITTLQLIDQIANNIVDDLTNGRFDINDPTDNYQMDKSIMLMANDYRERLIKLHNLLKDIQLKDDQLQLLTKQLNTKAEEIEHLKIQIIYHDKKLAMTIKMKDEDINMLTKQFEDKIDELNSNDRITTLQQEIVALTEQLHQFSHYTPSNPQNVISNNINNNNNTNNNINTNNTIINDNNNYLLEWRNQKNICRYLTDQLNAMKAKQSENLLNKLQPIKLPKLSIDNQIVNTQINRTESLTIDIYKHLSTIKIPDLSSVSDNNNVSLMSKRTMDHRSLHNQYKLLKNTNEQLMAAESIGLTNSHWLINNSINDIIGVIRIDQLTSTINNNTDTINNNNNNELKSVVINNLSISKLNSIFQ